MRPVTTATAQGARPYQEDRSFIISAEEGTILAVMDGHGGAEVAELAFQKVPELWCQHYSPEHRVATTIKKVFTDITQLTNHKHAGSSLSLVFIPTNAKRVYVGVLGDSPVIIRDSMGKLNVSPEHNARTNLKERQAVIDRGGYYSNGYVYVGMGGGLQLTRALGDASLNRILSREPDIYHVNINKKSFVLLASDGVLDPGHEKLQENLKAVETLINTGAEAQALVDRAVAVPTEDNATALLWRP